MNKVFQFSDFYMHRAQKKTEKQKNHAMQVNPYNYEASSSYILKKLKTNPIRITTNLKQDS